MHIRDYTLVQCPDPQELVNSVTEAIAKGYQPIGGCSVVREPANQKSNTVTARTLYTQAMIRLVKPEDALGIILPPPNGRAPGS